MVSKNSKEVVDNLLESLYYENVVTIHTYEQDIVEIMVDLDCTLSEALEVDFDMHEVDTNSVFDLVDYLERRLGNDLNKVNMMMQIYTRQTSDFKLRAL